MSKTPTTPNYAAWRYVDKREEFVGSSLRGESYRPGYAPHLSTNDTWMSEFETAQYGARRHEVTYIVWSFYTPIAYWSQRYGWYRVGQAFSSFTGRHRNGALLNVPLHRSVLTGERGDWTVTCLDCNTTRHFTRKAHAEAVLWTH